ncbi:MAG: VWA domain-containing protein [Deltaproteobacteria bacterium]|nr:VWA domain-containing protein [Deltaproteobacteria bacterium]
MQGWACVGVALSVSLAACSDYEVHEQTFNDVFLQEAEVRLSDVLFVVDDSGSMSEEQDRLAANFSAFLEVMEAGDAEWQLGVATTDVTTAEAGLLRGGIFSPSTPALAQAVGAAVAVGTDGSRDEAGLEAAALAVDGRNAGFVRPGAELHVVVFSDEDDLSDGEVADYVAGYRAAAGNGLAQVHAVVGDLPAGCASGSSAAGPGGRYVEAVALTAGWRESICTEDYSELLVRVGVSAVGLPTFALTSVPQPDTLRVWVDDVEMYGRPVDGFTYDAALNAIVFHGRAVPRTGMEIGVAYQIAAG